MTERDRPPHGIHFWISVLEGVIAHLLAPLGVAGAALVWLYVTRNPGVPWLTLMVAVLFSAGAYLAILATHFFFPDDLKVSRRPKLHVILGVILVTVVAAPLAIFQTYTDVTTKSLRTENGKLQDGLRVQKEKAEQDKKLLAQAQELLDRNRLQLYSQVTESLRDVLSKERLDTQDLEDLLHSFIESISLTKPLATGHSRRFRATVAYLDRSGRYLVVPPHGYYGYDFNRNITAIRFDIAPRQSKEDDAVYLERIGVAGWAFINGKEVLDSDVQVPKAGRYRYKMFPQNRQAELDRAMICVNIAGLMESEGDNPGLPKSRSHPLTGVLSISSPYAGVFADNDLAVARFFAVLFGKFKAPVDAP